MKEIRYTILYCVCEIICDSILLRFRFRNTTANVINYDSTQAKTYGSGSATLHAALQSLRYRPPHTYSTLYGVHYSDVYFSIMTMKVYCMNLRFCSQQLIFIYSSRMKVRPFFDEGFVIHEMKFFYLSATVACLTGSELTGSGAQVTAMLFGALHLINMLAGQSVGVHSDPDGSQNMISHLDYYQELFSFGNFISGQNSSKFLTTVLRIQESRA
jgi:hypothetical protein